MRSLLSERSVLLSSALLATNCSLEYICYAVNILPFYIIWWHLTFVVALLDPLFFRHDGNVLYVGFWSRWCGHSPFIWKLLPYFHNLYCYNGQGILITWLANMSSSWGKISYSSRLQTYSKEKSIGIKHRAAPLCYRSCVWTVFEDVLPIYLSCCMNTFVKSMLGMNFLISGSYIQFIMLGLSYSLGS